MRTRAALVGVVGLVAVAPAACGVIDLDFYVLGIGGAGTTSTTSATSTVTTSGTGGAGTGGAGTGGAGGQCMPGLASGNTVWSHGYGDSGAQNAQAVAVDAGGNVIVAGQLGESGSFDFGCGTIAPAVDGFFVTKLDPSGACVWSKTFASTSQVGVASISVDPSDDVFVTGFFAGSIVFASSPPLTSSGTQDNAFLVKLSPSGDVLWSESFGGDESEGLGVATDATGEVIVTGYFQGSLPFGGTVLTGGGAGDVTSFVLKLDANGVPVWGKSFGTVGLTEGLGLAFDASGNVLVTGIFGPTVDFGCGTLTAAPQESPAANAFVAKLSPAGACLWSKAFAGAYGRGTSVAVDTSENVVVAGYFNAGPIDFGAGPVASAGGSLETFVAKLSGQDGGWRWGNAFGATGSTYGEGVAADTAGNIFVTGYTNGSVDFGGGSLTTAGGDDVVVASFDLDGGYRWAQRFGDAQDQAGLGLAVGPSSSSHVVVVGAFRGTIDFGCAPLTSAGEDDAFVAAFVR